ncbi:uncharacterized protein LOC127452643 isoform X2 [Myxocyprinus asiaticus]|nr:uncharacterized protein LOC127452643 isoform X2 [Myxocyprinus asiaticus]XP_051574233.1 uncharacterized protein LOC127452643 isoform X2 [Myxocyprinus asiaticus]XP_051574235.1 uncharacterized protein LOC127452643 isoform X2 [Myxocyprinus asiaticus]
MNCALVTLLFCLNIKGTFSKSIVSSTLDQQVVFSCNTSSCENAEWRKTFITEATIGKCHKQRCTIEEGFQEKFTFTDNKEGLLLISAKYSDLGTYECICDGTKHFVKLDILPALNITAAELEIITLWCYANDAKDVTWLRDDERVLHFTINGFTVHGKGFESRVSLKDGCFKNGDLSLTMTGIRKTDAGLYRCFVNDETTKGYPHTYMLYVNEKQSSPEGNHTECNSNAEEALIISLRVIKCLVFIILVLLAVLTAMLYFIIKKQNKGEIQPASTTTTQTAQESVNESDNLLACDTTTSPPTDDSQSTPTVIIPTQESGTEYNKPSNTKPF